MQSRKKNQRDGGVIPAVEGVLIKVASRDIMAMIVSIDHAAGYPIIMREHNLGPLAVLVHGHRAQQLMIDLRNRLKH